jgi:molybdate transport system substrate-binding protein
MKIARVLLVTLALLQAPLTASAGSLTVAVAANVKYAFDELAMEFTKQTGVKVRNVVASSGKLTAQIKSGAPYDVFLSADMDYPAILYKDGQATTSPKVYANGILVLWTAKDVDLKDVTSLLNTSIKKVAIANPKLAPYGREAINAMDFYNVRTTVEPKLVFGESISQVNQYIDSKSVDVGFTAKAVVLSAGLQGRGKWVEVPHESYQPIAQGIVMLKYGSENNGDAARKFYDFVFSSNAQAIFTKYGYKLP